MLFIVLPGLLLGQHSMNEIREEYKNGNFETCKTWINELHESSFTACDFRVKGDIYQKLAQFEEAESFYNKASEQNCNESILNLNRGINQYNLGNYSTAQHLIQNYVLDSPLDYVGMYWLSVTYYMQGKMGKSLEILEDCFELNENYAPAYFLEGAIYYSRKQYTAALESLQTAHDKDNTLQQALFESGIVLLEMQRFEDAKKTFQSLAVEPSEFQAQAFYYAGEACYYLREADKACEYWKVAKDMGDYDASVNVTRFCTNGKKPKKKPKSAYLQF